MSATNDTQERTIPILPTCKGAALWGDHGACQCFSSALEASEARCAALARALAQIARMTPVFDAKGTASKRINEIAREALAAAPTREEETDPLEGLPPELARFLRDPSFFASQDSVVFGLIVTAVEDLRCPFVSEADVRCYLDRGHKGGHRPYPPEWDAAAPGGAE